MSRVRKPLNETITINNSCYKKTFCTFNHLLSLKNTFAGTFENTDTETLRIHKLFCEFVCSAAILIGDKQLNILLTLCAALTSMR